MSKLDTIAVPQWTQVRERRGVYPLGMQNFSVRIYQRLLPGISNVTLRMRYYGLYMSGSPIGMPATLAIPIRSLGRAVSGARRRCMR